MEKKTASATMLTLLLTSMLTLAFNIQQVRASGTIYIRADGSIDPPTAPISSIDNVTYTFTDNIFNSIVVERDNVVIDGNKYVLQGLASGTGIGCEATRKNVTIQNMFVTNFLFGIRFYSSVGTVIKNVTVTLCDKGIWIAWGSNANVTENIVWNNNDGIEVGPCPGVVARNIIAYNINGLLIVDADVIGNKIINNSIGIVAIDGGHLHNIYHNNFINNTMVADLVDWTGTWDDGYPSGGNYWSDYDGTDLYSGPYQNETESDGIGDTPYVIDANNQDRYPLMNPWLWRDIAIVNVSSFKTVVGQGYSTSINVTLENQGETAETFDVTLYADSGQIINETGLVGYWSFDEGSGTTAHDSSGNRNDGTVYGANWTDGKFGKALSFDGTDDYALVPASASLNISDAVTIAAWMKLENVPIEAYEFIDSAGYGYAAYVYVSDPLGVRFNFVRVSGGVGGDLQAEFWKQYGAELPYLPYNQWYYVVWMYDSSGYTAIYVNGNPYANTTLMSGKIDDYGGGVFINCRNLHKGILDELRIYNRTLNQQEIRAVAARARAIARLPHALPLANGDSITITFTWNTTDFAYGNYTISACAWPVEGETDVEDNTLTDGWIVVTVIGDINGDFKVDIKDLVLVIKHFGSYPSHPKWNPNADANSDFKVDVKDLVLVISHFQEHYP